MPPWDTDFWQDGIVRGTNSPSALIDYGTGRAVRLAIRWNSFDLNYSEMSRLSVEFGDWDPLAEDEPSAPEDCCINHLSLSEGELSTPEDRCVGSISVSESEKPAAVITLQFTAPLFLGPKSANNPAIPASATRAIIEPVIERQRQL